MLLEKWRNVILSRQQTAFDNKQKGHLQDQGVWKGDIGGGTVDRSDKRRIHHFSSDFSQTEDSETAIVATIFEMIRVFPHEWET